MKKTFNGCARRVMILKLIARKWKKFVENTYMTNPIKNPLVQQWVLQTGIFSVAMNLKGKRLALIKGCEASWGNRMKKRYYSSLNNTRQWTTIFAEHLVKDMLLDIGKAPTRGRLREMVPDWETEDGWYEVKARTYTTTGTAGEKIFYTPLKYGDITKETNKSLHIVLMAYQEWESEHRFHMWDDRVDSIYQPWRLMLEQNSVYYLKGSTLLKQCVAYKHRKNPSVQTMDDGTGTGSVVSDSALGLGEVRCHHIATLKPFLKWVGGKTEILEKIFETIGGISDIGNYHKYHEPFIGGGSVFAEYVNRCQASNIRPPQFILSDINSALIATYTAIKERYEDLVREMCGLRNMYTNNPDIKAQEEVYYGARSEFNSLKREVDGNGNGNGNGNGDGGGNSKARLAALFIFLNKTCFRGLYRENSSGEFNVPFGNYKKPCLDMDKTLLDWHKVLNHFNVTFKCAGFGTIEPEIGENDIVYLDPPYAPEDGKKSFTTYGKNGFGEEQQREIEALCTKITERGASFVQSNADCKFIEDLYPTETYSHKLIEVKRRITSNKPQNKTIERIITWRS